MVKMNGCILFPIKFCIKNWSSIIQMWDFDFFAHSRGHQRQFRQSILKNSRILDNFYFLQPCLEVGLWKSQEICFWLERYYWKTYWLSFLWLIHIVREGELGIIFNENIRDKENTAKRTMQYLLCDDLHGVGLQESRFARESVDERVSSQESQILRN